jgi:hypothetical protein
LKNLLKVANEKIAMLRTKLFLLLLLSGALAAKNDYSDCVEKLEEGEKYYIKIEGPTKSYYSYAFGNRLHADKQASVKLQARHSIAEFTLLLTTPEDFSIQEFTFKDDSLFAEMKPKKEGETELVKYYLGLTDDKTLRVSTEAAKLKSCKAVVKDKMLNFGPEDNLVAPTIENYMNLGKKYYFLNQNKVCLVSKKTATEDYAALVEDTIRKKTADENRSFLNLVKYVKNQPSLISQEPNLLQDVMATQIKNQLKVLEVPFNNKKTNEATKKGNNLLWALSKQFKAVAKHSDRINQIIEEKELNLSKDELYKKHFENYTAYEGDDKEKRNLESTKFDEDAFVRAALGKVGKLDMNKFKKVVHMDLEASAEKNTPLGEQADLPDGSELEQDLEGLKDGAKGEEGETEDGAKDEEADTEDGVKDEKDGKPAEKDSGKKSVAVASALAAILFFL